MCLAASCFSVPVTTVLPTPLLPHVDNRAISKSEDHGQGTVEEINHVSKIENRGVHDLNYARRDSVMN